MEIFETILEPYSRMHDLYQSYYRASISVNCERENIVYREKSSGFDALLRFLGRVRNSHRFTGGLARRFGWPFLDGIAGLLGAGPWEKRVVGKYVYRSSEGDIKICIDAEDSGDLLFPGLVEWSDVYFKTNYWPDRAYGAKVFPLANINPLVLTRRDELRACRDAETEWDLFGFFRVWGRIEHNLALFEALARLKCRKKLVAYLISLDHKQEVQRLEKAGVEWTTSPMPLKTLWGLAARSKLNLVRHGVDDCIPWRMTDIMAMAHCPVMDCTARTRWHVPLIENVHYLSLNVPPESNLRPERFADRVGERIEGWLSRPAFIDEIGRNAGAYFDENLPPERLGRYVLEHARQAGSRMRASQPAISEQ